MRLTIKLLAYVTVLTIATIVVYAAGPCEDSCNFNNTNCTTTTNTTYNQCLNAANTQLNSCFQQADQEWTSCYQTAAASWSHCINHSHQQEQGICNVILLFDQYVCDYTREQAENLCWFQDGPPRQICEQNFVLDQQQCANDFDNCLFICSTQNP